MEGKKFDFSGEELYVVRTALDMYRASCLRAQRSTKVAAIGKLHGDMVLTLDRLLAKVMA